MYLKFSAKLHKKYEKTIFFMGNSKIIFQTLLQFKNIMYFCPQLVKKEFEYLRN